MLETLGRRNLQFRYLWIDPVLSRKFKAKWANWTFCENSQKFSSQAQRPFVTMFKFPFAVTSTRSQISSTNSYPLLSPVNLTNLSPIIPFQSNSQNPIYLISIFMRSSFNLNHHSHHQFFSSSFHQISIFRSNSVHIGEM